MRLRTGPAAPAGPVVCLRTLACLVVLVLVVAGCRIEITPGQDLVDPGNGVVEVPEGMKLEGLGEAATAYLRADTPGMVIEVNAAEGHDLSAASLDHLVSVLETVLDKPDGIEVRTATFEPATDTWTLEGILEAEQQHRTTATNATTASLHILALNGEFAPGPILGVAYSSSSFAVFTEQLRRAGGPLAPTAAVERAVLVHEMGHLLRLVNIGYTSPRPREDPDSPHHSVNEGSVMHRAVEAVGVGQLLSGGPPDDFDDDDRADLEDLKAGRLP